MKKPNILLITGDHTRHDAVSINKNPHASNCLADIVKTPNLDRIANNGVTFFNSFTPDPICVPGRASITTGNYPHKCTGHKTNGGLIKDDQTKLAEHFADNGYRTYAIGKLHYVPYAPPGAERLLHGFQHAELCEEGRMIAQFDPLGEQRGIEDYHDYLHSVGWGGYERAHGIGNNDVHPVASPVPAEHHEESWVATRSIANLEKHLADHPDTPFLMWTSFTKPHSPYDPPRPYDTMYDPRDVPSPLGGWENEEILNGRDIELRKRRTKYSWDKLSKEAVQVIRAHYCGMMSFQDEMIGRITQFLEEKGIADNTIIIYTADHGDLLGDFGRFFKVCMYDGAVKIPFIWSVPGVVPSNDPHRRDQLVGLQDILPTLCSLSDIEGPGDVDGMDLTEILKNPETAGREFYISQTNAGGCQKYMLRTKEYKYIYSQTNAIEELYSSDRDDYEMVNLADDPEYTSLNEDFRSKLTAWCIENNDEEMIENGQLVVTVDNEPDDPGFHSSSLGWRKY